MLKCETDLVSLSVIDVCHDCLCVDNCQSSDCQTVTVLDWVNPACVPVSGKIVFTLSVWSVYVAPGSQQQFISAVLFLWYLGKVSKFDISLLNLCAQTSWKISVCCQIVSERNNVGFRRQVLTHFFVVDLWNIVFVVVSLTCVFVCHSSCLLFLSNRNYLLFCLSFRFQVLIHSFVVDLWNFVFFVVSPD